MDKQFYAIRKALSEFALIIGIPLILLTLPLLAADLSVPALVCYALGMGISIPAGIIWLSANNEQVKIEKKERSFNRKTERNPLVQIITALKH